MNHLGHEEIRPHKEETFVRKWAKWQWLINQWLFQSNSMPRLIKGLIWKQNTKFFEQN